MARTKDDGCGPRCLENQNRKIILAILKFYNILERSADIPCFVVDFLFVEKRIV